MQSFLTSIRIAAVTLLVCVFGHTSLVLGFAQVVRPDTANGSLLVAVDGTVIGSRLLAQSFRQPRWFWPRPSAVDYNATGAGGSNKSPTSPALTDRARTIVAAHGASVEKPLPPDLAAASGGGLDPHVTERGAHYQIERVAAARGVPRERLEALVDRLAFAPGGTFSDERLVNVLELNLALDREVR